MALGLKNCDIELSYTELSVLQKSRFAEYDSSSNNNTKSI